MLLSDIGCSASAESVRSEAPAPQVPLQRPPSTTGALSLFDVADAAQPKCSTAVLPGAYAADPERVRTPSRHPTSH